MVSTAAARAQVILGINDNTTGDITAADVRSALTLTLDAIDRIDKSVNILDYGAALNGTTDDTTAWNQALAQGKTVIFPEGRSVITNRLAFPTTEGVSIVGAGRNKSTLVVNSTSFNMSASAVVQFNGAYQGLKNIAFEFVQPSTSVRANVKAYPVAIDFNGHSRAELSCLRLTNAYQGIRAVGNCGGAVIDDIQLGCLNRGVYIDGALDSIRINRLHFWPFGISTDAGLTSIYSDGQTISTQIGRCDDLNMSSILSFQGRMLFGDYGSGGPFGVASNITLDSNYGRIEFSAGEMTLSSVYGSSAAADDYIISQTGGELRIAGLAMETSDLTTNPMVLVSGDDSVFIASDIQATIITPATRAFRQTGGVMMLSNGYFNTTPNQVRTQPVIDIASGRATLTGLRARDKGTGAGTFIKVATNDWNVVANNSAPGWAYEFPATQTNGIYTPNRPTP